MAETGCMTRSGRELQFPKPAVVLLVGNNRLLAPLSGSLGSRESGLSQDNSGWTVGELFPSILLQRPQVCSPSLGASFLALCCVERGKATPRLAPEPAHHSCAAPPCPPSQNLTQRMASRSQALLRRVLSLCLTDMFSM